MSSDYSYYPLTYPQRNIYKTEITYPGTPIGLITATMRIVDENIDFKKMEKALNLIIQHNDSMRVRIKVIDREPRQYFYDYKYEKYEIIDLRDQPIQKLYDFDKEQTETPIALLDSQLYKFTLLWLSDNEFAVFLKIHHLISDGWSTVRIGNYILDYYEKLQKGIEIEFDNIPSYREYIANESEYLSGGLFLKDKEFWHEKYLDSQEPATIKPRKSKLVGIKAQRKTFVLPERLVTQLRQYCKDTRTSIFGVVLSAFAIYLNRTTHRNDITLGTLVLNRSSRRQKNTVGMFISTVPIKVELESEMNFTDFNKVLTREWMTVLRHQRYPFELLLKDIREKNPHANDLFDIVFSYQNASFTENTSSKQRSSRWHFNHAQKESLTIHVHDRDDVGSLLLDYDYLTDLFYEKEIEFIHDNFIRILWHALDNPAKPMAELELISEKEKQKILYEFNERSADFDSGQTIVDMLVRQAQATPYNTALINGDRKLTYAELERLSNAMAQRLIKEGICPRDIVCVIVEKSLEMIVALIGVLKAGAAYFCLENDLPEVRKEFLLKDSQAAMLITNQKTYSKTGFDGKVLFVEDEENYTGANVRPDVDISPSDLAYMIYTSGTSGEPKGVLIEHKSVVNYIYGFLDEFKYTGNEKVLQQSSYSFDAFVEEVYPTLTSGACLVVANKNGAKDMKKLAETIVQHDVNVVSVSPLVLNELNKMGRFDSIKLFISGGDVLKYEYMDKLVEHASVYNTYGPTETTVCATYHKCNGITGNIPIGMPVANYKLYILDKNLNLLPIGVPGDLYISGPGLARGYHRRPELTKEMFIDNPFLPGEKMYKTNDIARWYPMGEIEYIGRADKQVKIRGMRVELGEIESQLLRHEKIKAAVAAVSDCENKKVLCLYYEVSGELSIQDIRSYLRKKLPHYMVPTYYLQMERLPLSSSGKVNLAALPDIKNMVLNEENEYIPPEGEVEEKLIELMQSILKKDKISMKDNFFDMGGDSLSLNTLVFDIIDTFGIEIPLDSLFRAEDMNEIAGLIKNAANSETEKNRGKNLILIQKGDPGDKDIFFVHDGIGGVGAYFDLSGSLKEYNIWGISADKGSSIAPKNVDIEAIAKNYVDRMLEESKEPFTVAGWCIGGTIAFEMIKQLEKLNKKVNALVLMDTIPPMQWDDADRFSPAEEKGFISENIVSGRLLKDAEETNDLDELWAKVLENIEHSEYKDEIIENFVSKIPADIKKYLDDYHSYTVEEVFLFINRVRTYHIARANYFPSEKVNSDVYYFGAQKDSIVKDKNMWEKYVSGKMKYFAVDGDHNSMLQSSCADFIAEAIRSGVV